MYGCVKGELQSKYIILKYDDRYEGGEHFNLLKPKKSDTLPDLNNEDSVIWWDEDPNVPGKYKI